MKLRFKKIEPKVWLFVSILGLVVLKACSSAEDATESETNNAGTNQSQTAISYSYPSSLAIAFFPKDETAGFRLTQEDNVKNISEKIKDTKKKLEGTVDKCIDLNMFKGGNQPQITCYEFDSDMNPARFADNNNQVFGTTNGTVGGSIDGSGNNNNEACMVAFARAQAEETISQIEQALALISGMLCQTKKDAPDTSLPELEKSIDLSEALKKATTSNDPANSLTVNSALITRISGPDDRTYYRSEVVVTSPTNEKLEINLVHSPGDQPDTGRGVLFTKRSGGTTNQDGNQDPNNSANKNFVMSIQYDRTIEADNSQRMRYEVRQADMINTIEPFTEGGIVNYGALADNASNQDVHNIKYMAFDVDVETNIGNMSYWQNPGGNLNEAARGFLFNVEKDTDNALKGCGVSGATNQMSIRKALVNENDPTLLKPNSYWHPRGDRNIATECHREVYPCQGNNIPNSGSKITKQCFKQTTGGIYGIASVTDTTRGYDVIQTTASKIAPPTPPKNRATGSFIKK